MSELTVCEALSQPEPSSAALDAFLNPVNLRVFLWTLGWEEMEPEESLKDSVWEHSGWLHPDDAADDQLTLGTYEAVQYSKGFLRYLSQGDTGRRELLESLARQYDAAIETYDPEYAQDCTQRRRIDAAIKEGLLADTYTREMPFQSVPDVRQLELLSV